MARDDWIGLGASAGVHLALFALFALLTAGRPETPALGALQLEMGAFAEGRPVQETPPSSNAPPAPAEEQSSPPADEEPAPDEPEESAEEAATPEASTPVDLPEQETASPGEDPPPEDDAPAEEEPDASSAPPVADAAPRDTTAARPPADAAAERSSETEEETKEDAGATTGDEGTGDDAEKASPFDIEGLDRTRLHGGLPSYTEKVNATIKVEITVGPQGRVVGQRLLQKANPSLERSVVEALRQWRFNRLPAGAPQKPQTGVVTFRFRLE